MTFIDQSRAELPWVLEEASRCWKSTVYIPPAIALVCLVAFLLSRIISGRLSTGQDSNAEDDQPIATDTFAQRYGAFEKAVGGRLIFAYKFGRLVGCFILLGASIFDTVQAITVRSNARHPDLSLALLFAYACAARLSTLSLTTFPCAKSATRHCNAILFSTWATLLYRDVWPLITFDLEPQDGIDASLIVQVVSLTVAGVAIPLFIPREYVPVDPQNPSRVPHPEQTASIASLFLYMFMTPIIHDAGKVSHLAHDKLPELADYDHAHYLIQKNFPHLDPFSGAKRRHLFFNLIRVFRVEYTVMGISAAVLACASFLPPVAVNRLLNYFETQGNGAKVSPWIWVLTLFVGPMLASICFQWYVFFGTRTWVRAEALLVQLVFDHSLRIRFKAESPSDAKSSSSAVTPVETPDTATVNDEPTEVGSNTDTASLKAKTAKDDPQDGEKGSDKEENNLVGKINTLVTVDLDNILDARDVLLEFISIFLEIGLGLVFLYTILGWSALAGFASMLVAAPLPGYLARLIQGVQERKLEKTDSRVQSVTEAVSVLRMIKLFGWEPRMNDFLREKRSDELAWLWKDKCLQLMMDIINFVLPLITMVLTYSLYTLVMKQPLKASTVFSSIAAFEIVQNVLHRTAFTFNQGVKGKVSLDRIGKFLADTELLDSYDDTILFRNVPSDDKIGFNNAVFSWSKQDGLGTVTPSSRNFRLRVDGTLLFKQGVLNLIIGPTGSGKTSVLMALLGEMHFMPPTVSSWFSLPRSGGIAYAAQESWVQNETIKENILFGSPYDEERYKKVLHQCALERDLELFEAGDATEVGEKGLTLSGGQKARVTLARAVYSSASIVLLDDVLAALDVHTSKWIVEKCLSGDLLKGRTVILVTHNVALTNPIASFVVAVGKDGRVQAVGSDALVAVSKDPELAHALEQEKEEIEIEKEDINAEDPPPEEGKKSDGKLIMAEEIVEGRLRWKALRLYLFNFARHPVLFLGFWVLASFFTSIATSLSVWFLGYWGQQYETHDSSEVDVRFYLATYSGILLLSCCGLALGQTLFNIGTLRASRVIHDQLIKSVFGATLRWLDETPAGRILARATQDIGGIDGTITWQFSWAVNSVVQVIVRFAGPVYLNPIFMVPATLLLVLGSHLSSIYLRAQLSVRREQNNAKAPVLSHFGAVIAGLVSVRAYGAQASLRETSFQKINHYSKVSRTSYNLNRWIGIRIDALGAAFTSIITAYLLVRRNTNAANTGYTINMCVAICQMIIWIVRLWNDLEVECNKLERINGYLNIEHEAEPTPKGVPPAAWPKSGELVVEGLSARYSATGPKVLHDLSFTVKSGERIGIVGRTGSGKSSLTLALLRCILTEGTVYFDGIPTSQINLDALRSAMTIIPQMPELLSGTLRRNLDPFDEHDDAVLNNALRSAGLFTLQDETDEARLTLDSSIASGGGNLSVGQRQIIALARAMVRNSKLLILDEATSAIDHKTDNIIQTTLRTELASDVTVLTIAHRLQTIMDADKIMVLDAGRIVEFDSPQQLLRKKGGSFKSMVDRSGDRAALYEMAQGRASGSTLT